MRYQNYLQSDEWKIKRQLALQQAGGRCRICNSQKSLQVHHRSYARKGTPEEVLDLVVLCDDCHGWFHKKKKFLEELNDLKQARENYIDDDTQIELEECQVERLILLLALLSSGVTSTFEALGKVESFLVKSYSIPEHVSPINLTDIVPDIGEWKGVINDGDVTVWQEKLLQRIIKYIAVRQKATEGHY